MAVRKLHSLKFHVEGGSAVIVPDLTSHNLALNPTVEKQVTAGESRPTYVATTRRRSTWDFDGLAIKTLLDNLGLAGLCITSGVNPGLVGYLEKFDDCGATAAGSVHRSFQVMSGLVVPRQLTVRNGEDATLSFQVVILEKSGNDSIILSDTAALPTFTITPARWTLGKMVVAGVTLADYTELTIDFGNEVTPLETESDIDASMIGVRTTSPEITVAGVDQEWFAAANVPLVGKASTHAGDAIYLRKRSADGTGFVADLTAEHVKFTFAGLGLVTTGSQGSAQDPQESTLMVHATKDSSGNDPIIIDTASAIT